MEWIWSTGMLESISYVHRMWDYMSVIYYITCWNHISLQTINPPNCPPKKTHGTFYTSEDLTLRRTISTPRSCQRATPTGPMIQWLPASWMQTGFNQVQHVRFCSFVVTDAGGTMIQLFQTLFQFAVNFLKLKHHVPYSSQLEPHHFQNLFVKPTGAMRKNLFCLG